MVHVTKLVVEITTQHALVSADQIKLVKQANGVMNLIEISGFADKIGVTDINVRLSDKPA